MPPLAPMIGAAALGTAAAGAVALPAVQAVQAMTEKKPGLPEMPKTPTVEDAAVKANERQTQRRAAMARSQTQFTSPLGISGEASVARKTLLGE